MIVADTPRGEQEVSLLDQIKYVTYGHTIADVMLMAIMLMQQCLVQRSTSKRQALEAFDAFATEMRKEIDENYDDMRAQTEQAVRQ